MPGYTHVYHNQMNSFHIFQLGALCFISSMAVADPPATTPFLQNVPGQQWVKVGYLDMTDPAQQCPDSWQNVTSPRASCEKKSSAPCDSVNITITEPATKRFADPKVPCLSSGIA